MILLYLIIALIIGLVRRLWWESRTAAERRRTGKATPTIGAALFWPVMLGAVLYRRLRHVRHLPAYLRRAFQEAIT